MLLHQGVLLGRGLSGGREVLELPVHVLTLGRGRPQPDPPPRRTRPPWRELSSAGSASPCARHRLSDPEPAFLVGLASLLAGEANGGVSAMTRVDAGGVVHPEAPAADSRRRGPADGIAIGCCQAGNWEVDFGSGVGLARDCSGHPPAVRKRTALDGRCDA
jgi:hypothetical protein